MAKALLLRALRQSFGHLVDGLESENFQLAVWSGEVHLENLSLRKDAFDGIDLPIEIKVGKIKSLKISVPWTKLGSEPVRVTIDGIYAYATLNKEVSHATLLASLQNAASATPGFLQRRKLREKRRLLKYAALTEGDINDDKQSTPESRKKKEEEEAGFWSNLLAKVVDNLIVEVRHCHIRIEDNAHWTNRRFAFGITLRSFSALTCDENGRVQFIDRTGESTLLHRMVKCEDASVYWDLLPDTQEVVTDEGWLSFLHASEFGPTPMVHQYILKPCSPHVLVSKNDAPSTDKPRWSLQIDLQGVHVRLSRTQFEDITAVYLAAESHIVQMSPNSRPMSSVSRNPRAWWRYAIKSVIQESREKAKAWQRLCRRVVLRQRYVVLYKRTKKAPWLEPLSEREKETLRQYEDELDESDVLAFRAKALAELRAQRAKYNPGDGKTPVQESRSRGFLRSFFGGDSETRADLTPEERAEIEAAINYLDASQSTRVPDSTRNMLVRSSLRNASLTLSNINDEEIMHIGVEGHLQVETCVGPYMKTSFHLVAFDVEDRFTKDSIFPVLISPKRSSLTREGSVMTAIIEMKPPNASEDVAIRVSVIPFKVILVPSFVSQLSKFFTVSEEARLGEMASEAISEWTENRKDDVIEALARRTLVSLLIEIEDPVIACPLNVSRSSADLHMIVLDLGQLRIESDDVRLRLKREEVMTSDGVGPENLAIDAWRLRSENVRAFLMPASLMAENPDDWIRLSVKKENVLFHDFNLDARLAVCVTPKLLQVAKTRLSVTASALTLRAPPSLFRFISKLGSSWSKVLAGSSKDVISTTDAVQESMTPSSLEVQQLGSVPAQVKVVLPSPPLLEVELKVAALITTLCSESETIPLARMELVNFNLKHTRLANGDVDSNANLENVHIYDLYSKHPPVLATSEYEHDLAPENGDSTSLISVKTQYRRDGITVNAKFNRLHVNWNPETILAYKNAYHAPQIVESVENISLPQAPTTPISPPALKLKVDATLSSFSLAMCKGDKGRVLALSVMSDAKATFMQSEGINFTFSIGNFKSLQPGATCTPDGGFEDYEFFSAIPGSHENLFAVEFVRGGHFKSKQGADESFIGVTISPARLVYHQQSILELMDYINEGVMGAIVTKAKDKITTRTNEKYRVNLNWSKPTLVIPAKAALETNPNAYFEFACGDVTASNFFEKSDESETWESHTHVEARQLEISGYLPSRFEGKLMRTSLVRDPVALTLDIVSPLAADSIRVITGKVTEIEICIPRVHYFLYHRMLRENILADSPIAGSTNGSASQSIDEEDGDVHDDASLAPETKVTYSYDRNDAPPSTFRVAIDFSKASLQILEEPGFEIATFAMRRAKLGLVRELPTDPTTTLLQVEVLDLVDNRPESRDRCLRHLILCDSSKAVEESRLYSFEVKYVGADALVEIDLHTFRSVVLLDLFSNVLDFITTTQPEEGSQYARDSAFEQEQHAQADAATASVHELLVSHPLEHKRQQRTGSMQMTEKVTPWRGSFRLKKASMFFVCDLIDPRTDAIVLGGDLELTWQRREDGCASIWEGVISRFELYRAEFPNAVQNASDEQSAFALHAERVGHQVTEPAEVRFEYAYEKDSALSKIHSRRIHVAMSQMENFFSISDLLTIKRAYGNFRRGDSNQTSEVSKRNTLRLPVYEWFSLGTLGCCWAGHKMDRPPSEIRPRLQDLPVKTAARLARKRLENKPFTVEFNHPEHGIEFQEQDGFVLVSNVDKSSAASGLIAAGDVILAVNFTPVLTKSAQAVRAHVEAELSSGLVSFTIHPSKCRDPLVLKDSFHLESAAVVVHFIDDIDQRDFPLMHLSFSKINAFRNDNNAGNSVVSGANLLLAMHYHDPISGRWEMLMSPWTANLGVHFLSHGQVDAKFDTSNDLEFRLSDVFVRAFSDAVRRVMNTIKPPASGKIESTSSMSSMVRENAVAQGACNLRNRTGLPLEFWLVRGDESGVSNPISEKIRVMPDEIIAFSFAHEKGAGLGTRRNYHMKRANRVQVILGEGKWQALPEICTEIVHRGSVLLSPTQSDASAGAQSNQIKVAWEVMLEDGRLCLEIRSFRRVENRLKCPIQILPATSTGPCPERVVVGPEQVGSLPLAYGDIASIRIRPLLPGAQTTEYQWSEPCYVELAIQSGTSIVTCAEPLVNSEKLQPFIAHIHVQTETEDGATIRFTVHAPIIVRNHLPMPLYCRLFSGRKQVGDEIILVPGGYSHVNTLSVENFNAYVNFRLKNSRQVSQDVRIERKRKWSSVPREFRGGDPNETVTSHKRVEETFSLSVLDGDGSIVPLNVVQETTEYEGIRYVVFCPVWLVNRTSLPLSYGYGTGKWSVTGAGTSCPQGVMLYGNAEESQGKLQVRVADSAPSAPFSVSAPDGKVRRLVVPGGPSLPYSFDLAVSVDVGSGDLYRTNIVSFAPRYMFLNRLEVNIAVRQIWEDMSGVVGAPPPAELTIRPHQKEPFWASTSTRVRPFRLEIRAYLPGEMDTDWSTPFTLEKYLSGRAVVPVELKIKKSDKFFRFNMEVREDQIAGSLDVDLYEWQAPETNLDLDDAEEAPAEDEYVTIELKKKILPKTIARLRFPKVDIVLRRDAAAKQKKTPPPPPPPPLPPPPPVTGLGYPGKPSSRTSTPTTPPPTRSAQLRHSSSSSSESGSTSGLLVPGGTQPWSQRKTTMGDSQEIARLTIVSLDLMLAKRSDGFRELQVYVGRLRVVDPVPGATFQTPIEGLPSLHPGDQWLIKFHIIQKDLVFEKFFFKLPGLKLKVDERFVLGLAKFANDAVITPLKGVKKVAALEENDDLDASQLIIDVIEQRDTTGTTTTPAAKNTLIFFNSFYISAFEIRLWYHQIKRDKATPSFIGFGLLSKMDIRIENHPVKFAALSLRKPFGSYNLYASMVRDHYEREARSQISGILMRSIDITSASLSMADSIFSSILGTEVKSKEFVGESLSNEEIVERYRRRIQRVRSLDEFVRNVVRNCAFDWSYNHTGLINSRRATIIGVINRSSSDIEIRGTLVRGQAVSIIPGGLAARQLGKDGVRITTPAPTLWDTSATCLFLSYGFLESVELALISNGFVARFVGTDTNLKSNPEFSAAFLAKDVSKWLSWYILVVENRVTT